MIITSCSINQQIEFKLSGGHTIYFDTVEHIKIFIDRNKEDDLIKAELASILEKDPNLDRPEDVGKDI